MNIKSERIKHIEELAVRLKEEHALASGFERFIFKGTSMLPLISEGDEVLVKHVKAQELSLGDVIVYKKEELFIIHRFLYKRNKDGYIVAKGDNSFKLDGPFNDTYFLGRAVEIRKNCRRPLKLDSIYRRLMAYCAGMISLAEAAAFVNIRAIRAKIFRGIKLNARLKHNAAGLITRLKVILLKVLSF